MAASVAGYVLYLPASFVKGAPSAGAVSLKGTGAGAVFTASLGHTCRGAPT